MKTARGTQEQEQVNYSDKPSNFYWHWASRDGKRLDVSILSTSWWCSAGLSFIPTPARSLCRSAGLQFAVCPWNCWRPTPQFCTGTAGVGICRRHHCSHQHRLFARRGFRGLPWVRARLGCQTELCQVQRDVAKCIETLPRPPSWFGLAQTSACTWCRAHCLHIPWRRGSREGGKKVGVVEGTQPFVPRQGAFPQCPCLASNLAHVCRFFHARLGCVQIRQSHLAWPFFWAGKRDLVARRTIFCPKFASGFGLASDEIKQVRCDYNGLGVSCPSSSCYKDLSAKPAPNDFHCSTRISCPRRVILKVGKKRGIWFWASERIFH